MAKLYNLARMSTATTGTGTITLGSAVSGFLSFASAGIADGDTVTYAIQDGASSEIGRGVYTASGTTLTRSVLKSTNSGAAISLSGTAQVFITPSAEDFAAAPIPINLGFTASAAGNALTLDLKGEDGNAPSASNEVRIPFRSSSAAIGTTTWRTQTSALSLTISSGSTLGTVNSVPFRIWIVVFDDAGTLRLGAIQRVTGGSSPTAMAALADDQLASSTAEGGAGAADSAGVIYTGTAVTSKAYRIIGYVEYSSGLGTAGTWAGAPTKFQVFGRGIPRPGDAVQRKQITTSTGTSTTANTYQTTNLTVDITPTSAPNLVRADYSGSLVITANSVTAFAAFHRGATQIGPIGVAFSTAGGTLISHVHGTHIDGPGTTSSTTYNVRMKNDNGATSIQFPATAGTTTATMVVEEIMA